MTTISQKNIVAGSVLGAALATQFTAVALTRYRILNATVSNDTGAPVSFVCNIVRGAATAKKIPARNIADKESYLCPELVNCLLEPGDILQASGLALNFDVNAFTQV